MSPKKGGNWCAASNCVNNSKFNRNLSFFRFPKNIVRSQRWVILCRREDLKDKSAIYLYNNCRLCTIHFEDIMFTSHLKNRLMHSAEPTIFSIHNPPPLVGCKRKTPSKRNKVEQTKQKTRSIDENYANSVNVSVCSQNEDVLLSTSNGFRGEDIEEPGSSSPSPGIHMQIIAAYNETTMSHAIQVKEEIEESDVTVEPSEEFSFIEKREEMVEMVNCNCTNNVDAPENPKINCPSHIESENITTCLFQPYCPANLSIVSVEAVHEDEKDFPCRWRVQYKFTELLQDPETKYEIPKIHETMRYIIEEWKPRNTLIMAEELITVNEELTWVFVYGLFCSCNRHPVFSDDLKTKQWWTYGLHNC